MVVCNAIGFESSRGRNPAAARFHPCVPMGSPVVAKSKIRSLPLSCVKSPRLNEHQCGLVGEIEFVENAVTRVEKKEGGGGRVYLIARRTGSSCRHHSSAQTPIYT